MIFPALSDISVNMRFRLMLAVMVSLAMFPILEPQLPLLPENSTLLLQYVFAEFVMGVIMGISARLFMNALQIAGEVIAFTSGLQASTLFDPSIGGQTSAPSLFLSIVGAMLVLALNLHHMAIQGVMESYQVFPVGEIPLWGDSALAVARVLTDAFAIGVKMAAPVMVIGFLTYVGFGVFNRLIPQIQVFFVALPLNIVIGIFILALTISSMLTLFGEELANHLFLITQGTE